MTPKGPASPPEPGACDPFELAQGERWFVVQTLSRRETKARVQLERQGFRVFLPVVERTIRHARRVRAVRAAAFPGYLFIVLDTRRDRWRSINGTIGVSRLVTGGTAPTPAPQGVVEALLGYRDETGICRFYRDLVAGQTVRFVSGPFAQMLGKLESLDGNGRVRVLLELLGGEVAATLDCTAIEAA